MIRYIAGLMILNKTKCS